MAVLGWLVEARESLGLSQGELAVELGVSQTAVSRWEAGSRQVPEDVRERIGSLVAVRGPVSRGLDSYPGAPEDPAGRLAWVTRRNRMISEGGAKRAVDAAGGGPIGAGKYVLGKKL